MREIVPGLLWIGNAMEAREIKGVLGHGINAVVDLAIEEHPVTFPRDVIYCRIPLVDGAGNSPAALRVAVDTVASFLTSETPTLVACGAGMSRGPAIVAAAMTALGRAPLVDALVRLTAGQPHDVSASLLAEISKVLR